MNKKTKKTIVLKDDMKTYKRVKIDEELAPAIEILNKFGIRTKTSCSGHGNYKYMYLTIDRRNVRAEDKPFDFASGDICLVSSKARLKKKGETVMGNFLFSKGAKITKIRVG